MKRHGNLWDKITELDNIYLAYKKARKGKSWQNTISRFDDDLDENIFNIRDALIEKTFTTSPYTEKMIYEPKQRIIYKLPFKTRLGSRGSRIPGALALGGAYPAVISFIQDPVNDCVIAFSFPTKFFESISCFRL